MIRTAIFAAVLVACGGRTGLAQHDASVAAEAAPPGVVPCGDAGCPADTEYCQITIGGPPPGVHIAECIALPDGCHVCSCITIDKPCQCIGNESELTITCQVP